MTPASMSLLAAKCHIMSGTPPHSDAARRQLAASFNSLRSHCKNLNRVERPASTKYSARPREIIRTTDLLSVLQEGVRQLTADKPCNASNKMMH